VDLREARRRIVVSIFGVALLLGLLMMPLSAQQTPPPLSTGNHIRVSGADVNNVIAIDTSASSLHRVLLLQEVRGVPVDAHVDLWPIMTPDGTSLDMKATLCDTNGQLPDPLQFGAQSVIRVCLDPTLPSVGSYKAALSLLYADTSDANKIVRDTFTIAVERHPPANVVSLSGLPVGPTDTGFLVWPPGGTPPLELRVTLAETAGLGAVVSPPVLLELSQFGPNDTAVQVSPLGPVTVLDDKGATVSDNIVLRPYETRVYKLKLSNQLDAGQFRAKVQVRTADAGIAQTAIDVRLRHNWIWAALIIIVGALGSFFLRSWIDSGRTRAVQDQRLQEQLRQIPPGTWPGNRLNQYLVSQLESARTSLELGQAVDVESRCQLVQDLLPQIDEINQSIDQAGLTDTEKDFVDHQVSDALSHVVALFNNPNPAPADKQDAQNAIKLVGTAIQHAQDAARIQAEIDLANQLARDPLLAANQTSMTAHAQAAQEALASGSLDTARAELSLAMAPNGLADNLAGPLEDILKVWTDSLAAGAAAAPNTDPKYDTARSALAQVDVQVHLLQSTPASDVQVVLSEYNDVLKQMASTAASMPDAVRKTLTVDRKLAIPAQWALASPKPATSLAQRLATAKVLSASRSGDRLGRLSIYWKDNAVSLISIIVSALVGLQLLWVANATFGGLNDYITALVWGFGLHQLNETVRQAGPTAISSVLRSGKV
jgi:hypothetical protein